MDETFFYPKIFWFNQGFLREGSRSRKFGIEALFLLFQQKKATADSLPVGRGRPDPRVLGVTPK